jgi:hypothetical protein
MKVINLLPVLLERLREWESPPKKAELAKHYLAPMEEWLKPMLEDWELHGGEALAEVVAGLDWKEYRESALELDPAAEEARLLRQIRGVEKLLGVTLSGEAVLFGAFTMMDGYARFDRGSHRVFLAPDEFHLSGSYMDILMSHELTHVARETRPEMWAGHGLPADLSHDDFSDKLPVIEHLYNEGFSCAVSERLNPCDEPWHYAYQSRSTLAKILEHGAAVDKVVHEVIRTSKTGWGQMYNPSRYKPKMPQYCHYVWAWAWARSVIERQGGGDPRAVLAFPSSELVDDALAFRLTPDSVKKL